MAVTTIGRTSPLTQEKWSALLAVDASRESYFTSRFVAAGADVSAPIQLLTELEAEAGDAIHYDLSAQINAPGTDGDDILEGSESALTFMSATLYVDQIRQGVSAGGQMTRKRTVHSLRAVAKARLAEWFATHWDQALFIYLSGARGVNDDFQFPLGWTGRANNTIVAPDVDHLVYGGNATAKNDLDSGDTLSLAVIDAVVAKAKATTPMPLMPVKIDGNEYFVCVMSPHQEYSLRTATGESSWLSVQKAAAAAEGRQNPIFTGSLGLYNGTVLHSHQRAIRFSDYGNPATVRAARALFMGRQAGVMAFGSPNGKYRMAWNEESDDRGNTLVITAGSIWGCAATIFDSKRFGMIAIDTAIPSL